MTSRNNMSIDYLKQYIAGDNLLKSLFDTVRLIEPGGTNNVCQCNSDSNIICPNGEKCYEIWNQTEKCSTCVCEQAMKKKHKMVKLEYIDGQYYLVMAYPCEIEGASYIIEMISDITEQFAISDADAENGSFVENLMSELESATSTDAFTGLFNKTRLEKEYDMCVKRGDEQAYIAIFDIDSFKEINDTYGHVEGDEVILKLADIIQKNLLGKRCCPVRFGGDEFIVLMSSASEESFRMTMDKIRSRFIMNTFVKGDEKFNVGLSYGIAKIDSSHDLSESIEIADRDLYAHKDKNKNTK